MGVTDFDTKVAVVVRDDLEMWQRLNVTAFLMSGVTARAGEQAIGEPYRDADGREYLPLLVQPILVLTATGAKLHTVRERAERRGVDLALYTADMFLTGNDDDNLQPPGGVLLSGSYSLACASDARRVTFTEYFDGWRLTVGLSISFRRPISLIHWLGLSTALTCLEAFALVP